MNHLPAMIFDQSAYDVRCEWGAAGVSLLAPISDVVIIVDVLSFSTSIEIATRQGAYVFPYRWNDETAYHFAKSVHAEVADGKNKHGFGLSPSSLRKLPDGARLVLPSPNGSTISLLAGTTPVIAGCLRNCQAVAESAMRKGSRIAVIPAGEKWADGALRPSVEDLMGAGAIISYLRGNLSPEALVAIAAYEKLSSNLLEHIKGCISGREKIERNKGDDLHLAAELNISDCVPVLENGAFRKEA